MMIGRQSGANSQHDPRRAAATGGLTAGKQGVAIEFDEVTASWAN
jgi:hypothetical protein